MSNPDRSTDADSNDPDSSTDIDTERPWRDEKLLRYLYERRDLTQDQAAAVLGCSHSTITSWCDRHDIDTLSQSGADHHNFDPIDRETLVELHTERGLSINEIAKRLNRSRGTVRKYLTLHDVPPQDSSGDAYGD